MKTLELVCKDNIIIITLRRGKVNALNELMVDELLQVLTNVINNPRIDVVIITGYGKFFSFGFDIPSFIRYTKSDFKKYLLKFTSLYRLIFMTPIPVIAALNGHTIAGGCMIATACDYRVMAKGNGKISLNELSFGSTVFNGSMEILRYCVGQKNAQEILFTAKMYSVKEAFKIGLIDKIVPENDLINIALSISQEYASRDKSAFSSMKRMLRSSVDERIKETEVKSIDEFLEVWFSEDTMTKLKKIKIYS